MIDPLLTNPVTYLSISSDLQAIKRHVSALPKNSSFKTDVALEENINQLAIDILKLSNQTDPALTPKELSHLNQEVENLRKQLDKKNISFEMDHMGVILQSTTELVTKIGTTKIAEQTLKYLGNRNRELGNKLKKQNDPLNLDVKQQLEALKKANFILITSGNVARSIRKKAEELQTKIDQHLEFFAPSNAHLIQQTGGDVETILHSKLPYEDKKFYLNSLASHLESIKDRATAEEKRTVNGLLSKIKTNLSSLETQFEDSRYQELGLIRENLVNLKTPPLTDEKIDKAHTFLNQLSSLLKLFGRSPGRKNQINATKNEIETFVRGADRDVKVAQTTFERIIQDKGLSYEEKVGKLVGLLKELSKLNFQKIFNKETYVILKKDIISEIRDYNLPSENFLGRIKNRQQSILRHTPAILNYLNARVEEESLFSTPFISHDFITVNKPAFNTIKESYDLEVNFNRNMKFFSSFLVSLQHSHKEQAAFPEIIQLLNTVIDISDKKLQNFDGAFKEGQKNERGHLKGFEKVDVRAFAQALKGSGSAIFYYAVAGNILIDSIESLKSGLGRIEIPREAKERIRLELLRMDRSMKQELETLLSGDFSQLAIQVPQMATRAPLLLEKMIKALPNVSQKELTNLELDAARDLLGSANQFLKDYML